MGGLERRRLKEQRWRERAFQRSHPPVPPGFLRLDHYLEHVKRVGGADQRPRALAYAFNQVPQPVRPGPIGSGLLEALPTAGAVLPDFVAVRVPIIPEQIDRAVG